VNYNKALPKKHLPLSSLCGDEKEQKPMNPIRTIFIAVGPFFILIMTFSVEAADKPERHLPFTAEQDADGARFVCLTLGKSVAPYTYG